MRVIFLGVGEAFDERHVNCSVLVEAAVGATPKSIMLDCGFTAPFALFRSTPTALDLDALWVSHFHGDHFFGVPALLLRFWEEKRTKPFLIIGQAGVEEKVRSVMEHAYASILDRCEFPIEYQEIQPEAPLEALGMSFTAAPSEHPKQNYSVRIDVGEKSLFYSGDGRPTPQTLQLAQNTDLVIHESFSMEEDTPGHGTIPGSIAFAKNASAKQLALIHIRRGVRRPMRDEIDALVHRTNTENSLNVLLPKEGDLITL